MICAPTPSANLPRSPLYFYFIILLIVALRGFILEHNELYLIWFYSILFYINIFYIKFALQLQLKIFTWQIRNWKFTSFERKVARIRLSFWLSLRFSEWNLRIHARNSTVFRQISDSFQKPAAEYREPRYRLCRRDQLLRPWYPPRRQLHQLRSSRRAGTWSTERSPYVRALPEEVLRGAHAHNARVRQDQGEVRSVFASRHYYSGGKWEWKRASLILKKETEFDVAEYFPL